MQAQLLVTILCVVAMGSTVAALLAWRSARRWRTLHAAQNKRLAWAEWWAKNALEFSSEPATARALEAFALCALRSPSLRHVAQQLKRVANPAREIGLSDANTIEQGEPLWLQRLKASGQADATIAVVRARGALAELQHGVPLWTNEAGELRWTIRSAYEDRRAGGAWLRSSLEEGATNAVAELRAMGAAALLALSTPLSHEENRKS